MQDRTYKQRVRNVTSRITILDENTIEVHSTLLGYPIRFDVTDELRAFLRNI